MITYSLCVELDTAAQPPVVADVVPIFFNGHAAFKPHVGYPEQGHGPRAILTEVTCPSPQEAILALKGIIENEPALEWVRDYPGVKQFLNPSPFGH